MSTIDANCLSFRQHYPTIPRSCAALLRSEHRLEIPYAGSAGPHFAMLLPRRLLLGTYRRQIWRQVTRMASIRHSSTSCPYSCVFPLRDLRSSEWAYRFEGRRELDGHLGLLRTCLCECKHGIASSTRYTPRGAVCDVRSLISQFSARINFALQNGGNHFGLGMPAASVFVGVNLLADCTLHRPNLSGSLSSFA